MELCFRIFLFILMLGPIIIATLILIFMSLTANIFTLVYFILFGWCCEIKLCSDPHGPFIEKTLKKPWTLIKNLFDKISDFLEGDDDD